MGTKKATAGNVPEQAEPRFSKEQLAKSKKYREKRDLVDALLKDGETYTTEQVDNLIENFMKGKVN